MLENIVNKGVEASQTGGRRKRRTHARRTHRRRTQRRHTKKQYGGRRNAVVIGKAIASALVPFGLFAAQKKVQNNLSVKKTQKRKSKGSRRSRK